MDLIFSNSFKALKSGGLFGVVEHRANPGTSITDMKKSGYVTEEHAIMIAKKHGFVLVGKMTSPHHFHKGRWTVFE